MLNWHLPFDLQRSFNQMATSTDRSPKRACSSNPLKRFTGRHRKPPRHSRLKPCGRCRPSAEALEDRLLLSVDYIITEFAVPTPSSLPQGLTTGPDGNIWFVEEAHSANKIARITPMGAFTEFMVPTAAAQPFDITTGPDGNLWFTEPGYAANAIGRMTPGGVFSQFIIPVLPAFEWPATKLPVEGAPCWGSCGILPRRFYALVPIPKGCFFLGLSSGFGVDPRAVRRRGRAVDPPRTSGFFTHLKPSRAIIPTAASVPQDITVGPDGNLWFTEYYGNAVGRITTSGAITEYPIPTSGGHPDGIVTGPDGNLWFTESEGSKIGRITTSGAITEFTLPTAGAGPAGITVGPDHNLWFAEEYASQIGTITTAGAIAEYPAPANSRPYGITTGPDGNLWFTEYNGNAIAKIGRITTAGTVSEFVVPTSGSAPMFITSGPDGDLWFSEQLGNNVARISLQPDITATSLSWDSAQQGVDFSYQISGSDLPQTTTAALYWATGTTPDTIIGKQGEAYPQALDDPAASQPIATTASTQSYTSFVSGSDLGTPPPTATNLLLYLNPPSSRDPLGAGSVDESDKTPGSIDTNNVKALAIPDVVMLQATTIDSKSVTINYRIDGTSLTTPLDFFVYRSSTPSVDGSSVLLASTGLNTPDQPDPGDVTQGEHDSVRLNLQGAVLTPDTARPYVIVVANPHRTLIETDASDDRNDTASFEIFTLGVVVNGLEKWGQFVQTNWIYTMADALMSDAHYTLAIPFDWSAESNLPLPGLAVAEGHQLAALLPIWTTELLTTHQGPAGHSRGAVVVNQALTDLAGLQRLFPSLLRGSYLTETLL